MSWFLLLYLPPQLLVSARLQFVWMGQKSLKRNKTVQRHKMVFLKIKTITLPYDSYFLLVGQKFWIKMNICYSRCLHLHHNKTYSVLFRAWTTTRPRIFYCTNIIDYTVTFISRAVWSKRTRSMRIIYIALCSICEWINFHLYVTIKNKLFQKVHNENYRKR